MVLSTAQSLELFLISSVFLFISGRKAKELRWKDAIQFCLLTFCQPSTSFTLCFIYNVGNNTIDVTCF